MNTLLNRYIPISQARSSLADLTDSVKKEDFIVLTKGGVPKAALVDIAYLSTLQESVKKLYKQTYIDPALLPYTRSFSQSEIDEWEKADSV